MGRDIGSVCAGGRFPRRTAAARGIEVGELMMMIMAGGAGAERWGRGGWGKRGGSGRRRSRPDLARRDRSRGLSRRLLQYGRVGTLDGCELLVCGGDGLAKL